MKGSRAAVLLLGLSAAFVYAAFRNGGVETADWNVALLFVGTAGSLYWLAAGKQMAPPLDRRISILLWALPAYVALQLIPLPLGLLELLSPERGAVERAMSAVGALSAFAPISAMPDTTFQHLSRVLGCTAVFLLVRECTWQLGVRAWWCAAPVLVVGALEAMLGIAQMHSFPPRESAVGTYINRDHYVGLIEMAFPFAAMLPFAGVLGRSTRGRRWSGVVISTAVAILLLQGAVQSLSRTGVVALVFSLVVAVVLMARGLASARALAGLVGGLALAATLSFYFLPPGRLFARFGDLKDPTMGLDAGRAPIWKESLQVCSRYLTVGCGLGCRQYVYIKDKTSYPLYGADFAHCDYLQAVTELGVPGALIAFALIGTLFARTVRRARSGEEGRRKRYLATACAGSMAAIGLHSWVDYNLAIPATAMLLAWVAGIGEGLQIAPTPAPVAAGDGPPVIEVMPKEAL